MRIALSLLVLLAGVAVSPWIADRAVHRGTDETDPKPYLERKRIVAAMWCTLVALLVMVGWITEATNGTDRALNVALANAEANCRNVRQFQELYERGLIADVRLARTQYDVAVGNLEAVAEILAQPAPVLPPGFAPELQVFVDDVYQRSRDRTQHEYDRTSSDLSALRDELSRRESTLDEARATQITECPPADSGEPVPVVSAPD